jgi:hypothetical protein
MPFSSSGTLPPRAAHMLCSTCKTGCYQGQCSTWQLAALLRQAACTVQMYVPLYQGHAEDTACNTRHASVPEQGPRCIITNTTAFTSLLIGLTLTFILRSAICEACHSHPSIHNTLFPHPYHTHPSTHTTPTPHPLRSAICEACRISKHDKSSACTKDDEEHIAYR